MWRAWKRIAVCMRPMKTLGINTNFAAESDDPGQYHWHIDGGLLGQHQSLEI